MRQLLEMQMKMLSRMENSMVRFLILKALMESLHLASGLYRMEQRLEKRLFKILIIVWMQAKQPNNLSFLFGKAALIHLLQTLIQQLGVMMGPACINFKSVPGI